MLVAMPRPTNALTLEAIGRLAGVSRSTVSRVVNDHPDVRADVRARVEAVIAETGYQPNQAARSLVSARTGLVGLVLPIVIADLFADPYFSRLIRGVSEQASDAGSVLSLFPIHGDEAERLLYPNLTGGSLLDGLLVTAGSESDGLIKRLHDSGTHFVAIGRPSESTGISYVDVDSRGGSAAAVEHLVGHGRKRVAHVGTSQQLTFGVDRYQGYLDGLKAAGLDADPELFVEADATYQGGAEGVRRVMAARPDAVFFATDPMAWGGLAALQQDGFDVGSDVAVVAFDGLVDENATKPRLTTVAQPTFDVGRTAVSLALGLVGTPAGDGPTQISLGTKLVVRDSCGTHTP
jgi:LacI family transcriptional regulator